jgi:cytochrome c peroxidase
MAGRRKVSSSLAFLGLSLALAACGGGAPSWGGEGGAGLEGGAGGQGHEGGSAITGPLPDVSWLPSPSLPAELDSYSDELPASFETPQVQGFDRTPEHNPVTDAGATLGRVLFYDKRLSRNGSVACASCHQQSHGFSDPRPLSVGWDGRETGRHSMPVHDARFYARDRFFWDERTTTLEAQVLEPIQNELEMGMTLGEVEQRLAEADYYPPLFEAAFGDPAMTSERVALALAQFVRAMVPHQSRWDAAVAQVESIAGDLPGLSAEENRGKEIFFGQHDPSTRGLCGTCHLMQNELAFVPPGAPPPALGNTAIFFMIAPANNGLDAAGEGDPGVGGVTGVAADEGKMKSPSLRDVALRPPYMHDGRFATLAEVVDHYDAGIVEHPNLDPALRASPGGPPLRLHLSPADKAALVAFLGTLSDLSLGTDARFSDPFSGE